MITKSDQETVVIIGGGIIAIACAHYLTEAGFRVIVIERDTIAGACSHGNCGFICPSHILPLAAPGAVRSALPSLFNPTAPFRIKLRSEPAFLRWMWQFARHCTTRRMLDSARHLKTILDSSVEEYQTLLSDEDIACQWQQTGLLYVLQSAAGVREFAKTDTMISNHFGVSPQRIEGKDLPMFDPALKSGLAGAFFYKDDASLRPDQLASAWVDRLKKAGVTFIEHCNFEAADCSNGHATEIHTSQMSLRADHYILAAGAFSGKMAKHFGRALPIEPGKGYSVTMERPTPSPLYPMLLPEHHVGITPFDDGFRLGSMMEFVGFDQSLPEFRTNQLREAVKPYLRATLPSVNKETWFGWRPMTWDSLPVIGKAPEMDNVYLATGHNMLGMTLAPATGKLIAEIIQGRTPHIDPEPYSPARF